MNRAFRTLWLGGRTILAAALALLAESVSAATLNWKANTTGDWFDVNNWTEGTVPTNGDIVWITNSGSMVILSNSTYLLGDLTLGGVGNYTNTLLFTNWTTQLTATNIYVNSRGNITHAQSRTNLNPLNTNRVWIVCTNLTIATNGSIKVDGQGHWAQQGPGAPVNGSDTVGPGASHGGKGGDTSGSTLQYAGSLYGLTNAPFELGSGGGKAISGLTGGGAGGGAIWIEAASITVNGTIAASGSNAAGMVNNQYGSGGSGGSIYIGCGTFGGSTNGLITANGGAAYSGNPGSGFPGGSGGGRIAVIYTNVAADTGVRFSVAVGSSRSAHTGEFGTVYFPDTALLSETLERFSSGWIVITNFSSWSVNNLTISNANVAVGAESLTLTVTNNVVIGTGVNSSASLILGYYRNRTATTTVNVGNSVTLNGGKLGLGGRTWDAVTASDTARDAPATLMIVSNLLLTNGGSLWIYSGLTNAIQPDYGALVVVTGNVALSSNTWIYVSSNPTNGGSALFRMNELWIPTNAGINANSSYNESTTLRVMRGYYGQNGPGVGESSPTYGAGAGHGGQGGDCSDGGSGGSTNDTDRAPVFPGSGGAYASSPGGAGGGVVRLEAVTVTLNGTLTADAAHGGAEGLNWGGGGAGGSIYLRCRLFSGNGLLSADGGNGSLAYSLVTKSPGGGGGGRIAVWSMYWGFLGTTSVTGGVPRAYTNGATAGQDGTLFWGQVPLPGTIIKAK